VHQVVLMQDPVVVQNAMHKLRNRFWRSDELMESVFGKPVDEAYWEANDPANMAITNAAKIRDSGLGIYMDAGDEDMFHPR